MTTSATNASFYANFAELNSLKREAKTQSKESLRAAAQQFESLFTQMILKSMRQATSSMGDELTGSNEVDFYQGMFDQQLAAQLSKGKGLGLADMLVEQLTRSGMVKNSGAEEGAIGSTIAPVQKTEAGITSQPTQSREEFVRELWPHAEKAAQSLGVDPSTLVAHAALETGWGKRIPCNADGSSSFNLFGIKANSKWSGDATEASTTEFENQLAVKRVERFKSYDSPAQCFDDYAALLGGAARYADVRNSGSDANQFAQALQRGGYATDPNYAQKLSAIAGSLSSMLRGDSAHSSFNGNSRSNGGGAS